ncbi:MAG: UbiD family decarboxylase [Alphaproteobacteria bacterium]|nr:UbiD family decarboxylase [Pseudomonadota bacterium]TDI67833.1 MAG: UbiD family decarboxylase [Alphaproteobacteria bacterium]
MASNNEEAMRLEALGDLRRCLDLAREIDDLEVVEGADPDLEIGALYELSLEKENPPVIVFDQIVGYPKGFRVAVNVRSSRVFDTGQGLEQVQKYRKHRRPHPDPIDPVSVESGPVLENVQEGDDIDTLKFPAPKWHGDDGGRYIGTECMVITRDPDTGWVNAGTYRVEVHDKNTLCAFIEPGKHGDIIRKKYWARGEPCPMVVTVGQAPVLGAAAASTAAEGVSEFAVAGARLGRPIELLDGKHTGIPFPADAEIVFEGFMPPPSEVSVEEGPFGEWPGYYASNSRPEPVLQVKAVYHRNDPIIVGAPPMRPVLPGFWYGTGGSAHFRAASLWDELEAAGVPGIKGVWTMPGGGPRFIRVIAIEQLHAGHAKMAGLVAAGCGSAAYLGRIIIIVDDDIDITNSAEVMWAMATRWDPKTQTDIIDGCWTGYIDPMLLPERRAADNMTNSRIIMYAVRPYHWKDDFPKVNMVSREYAAEVRKRWSGKLDFLGDP